MVLSHSSHIGRSRASHTWLICLIVWVVWCLYFYNWLGLGLTDNTAPNDGPPLALYPSVEDLMYKYASDKSRDDHGYTKLYNMIFSRI
jgi:hypothetical protein